MSKDTNHGPKPKRWIKCEVEAEYFGDERKSSKMQRKIAISKDRSKYKKTDLRKQQKQQELALAKQPLEKQRRGRVLSITPQGIVVEDQHETFICSLRGVLKKEKTLSKNLVTVGDFVFFELSAENEGYISHIEPRRTALSRADNLSRRKEQLIAANIDLVIITTSIISPPLKPSLVDRYIIATRKGGMEPLIVINKIDLLDNHSIDQEILLSEKELYEEFLKAYLIAQVPVIPVSVLDGRGLEQLKLCMKDKASVFSGQSGVGKSSLINAVTGSTLRTGKIVDKTQKGSHTTTKAQLLPLEFGGWCIDTPGIKSFGVWDLKREEVEGYFSEIHTWGLECKFPNCSHLLEKDCAVIRAVESGDISFIRYESYQILMDSISSEHMRR